MIDILTHLKKYSVAYILILAHSLTGAISNFAILIASVWAFVYFVMQRKLDLYLIFLLLSPGIAFGTDPTDDSAGGIFSNFSSTIIIGPLALSTRLAFALAVPVRLFIHFRKIEYYGLFASWGFALVLAAAGLVLAVIIGAENEVGLTVGFRIALSIGAMLIPLSITDRKEFYSYLDNIMNISIFLLMAGLLTQHWLFVTVGFIPYAWHRTRSILFVALTLIFVSQVFISFSTTITIIATLFVSILFYNMLRASIFTRIMTTKFCQITLILLPLVLTTYVLSMDNDKKGYDLTTIGGYVRFKTIGDRKPIWDATYERITKSSFFITPAGSKIDVYFDYINTWQLWTAGSHNIFLEMGRQISPCSMIILSFLLIYMMVRTGRVLHNKDDLVAYYSFLSVYLMFGVTGQALIYDGVGFLYWLLLGQFYRILHFETNDKP